MLLHGDCLDRLPELGAGSIDLTVTSPPYDNLRTYNGTLNDWTAEKWQAVIRELFRVTKDGGVVVWVVGDATVKGSETGTSFRQALYAMECGFRLHDTMIWNKTETNFPDSTRYHQAFEFMFVWAKGAPASVFRIEDKPNRSFGRVRIGTDRNADGSTRKSYSKPVRATGVRLNVWEQSGEKGAIRASHPATFPEALARDHILSWSNPGDVVLDPFLGSGTTAKMALLTGRRFIGIERDAEYLAIAERRIADAQPPLIAMADE
jgi:site-specific DNA-methyltransferase (adenine-specific)